ncbi:hypothetical protein V6N13_037739 [Hibiscus sabdariffa]
MSPSQLGLGTTSVYQFIWWSEHLAYWCLDNSDGTVSSVLQFYWVWRLVLMVLSRPLWFSDDWICSAGSCTWWLVDFHSFGGDRVKETDVVSSKEKGTKWTYGQKDVTGLELIVKKARSSVGTSATGSADVPEEVLTPTALLSVEAVGQPRRSP